MNHEDDPYIYIYIYIEREREGGCLIRVKNGKFVFLFLPYTKLTINLKILKHEYYKHYTNSVIHMFGDNIKVEDSTYTFFKIVKYQNYKRGNL